MQRFDDISYPRLDATFDEISISHIVLQPINEMYLYKIKTIRSVRN